MPRLYTASLIAWGALAAATNAAPPSDGWRLTFADEFSGSSVDPVKWATQYSWGRTHNHTAYMKDENVGVSGGDLTLSAIREPSNGKPFTSGVISSHSSFRFTQGYAEMSIKMPRKRGSWPAFWMLANGWPPEIDVVEYPLFTGEAHADRYAVNSFWGQCCNPPSNFSWIDTGQNLSDGYHTFGLEWTESQLKYYFDGQIVKTAANQPQFENMYLIFNYAVGGWPGSPDQTEWANGESDATRAEWVRVWQKNDAPTSTSWTQTSGGSGSWGTSGNWSAGAPNWERQSVAFPDLGTTPAMEVRWADSKTVGEVTFNGDTVYTLAQERGGVESLMFANGDNGWSRLAVESGAGGHIVNSRLDAWSNVSIENNGAGALTINADLWGQTRANGGRQFAGGRFFFRSDTDGQIVVNGDGFIQHDVQLDGVDLRLNGQLFKEDTLTPIAALRINDSTLRLASLTAVAAGESFGALGYLPASSQRLIIDDGVIELSGPTSTTRGFTIGSGGATIAANARALVAFEDDTTAPERDLISDTGGELVLSGRIGGTFNKRLSGDGGLRKTEVGVWTVGAQNTYTGDTSVEAGVLSITNPYLADDADVLVATGATFDLDFSGTDTIAALFIDGAPQPIGTHGAIGSGADFESSLFNGSGLLDTTIFGGLAGDYNSDGVVDAADYTLWRDRVGFPAGTIPNDADGGSIGDAQYATWLANFGAVAPPSFATPEPGALAMLVVLLPSFLNRRRGASPEH